MSVIRLDSRVRLHRRGLPDSRHSGAPARREQSDVWPDCGTELAPSELKTVRESNRFKGVLWEGTRAVAISVGVMIVLMAMLNLLGVR